MIAAKGFSRTRPRRSITIFICNKLFPITTFLAAETAKTKSPATSTWCI